MPKTEAQKAQARKYARRAYWDDPERFRAESSACGRRRRADDRAAGVTPTRVRTEAQKAADNEGGRRRYWDPERVAERADRERVREQARLARQTPEAVEQRRAAARARIDPAANRSRVKAWRAAHPAKARAAKLRRRARELNAPVNDFTAEQWLELLDEFNGICAYCPAPATTQDHLTPLSRGGAHTASNIVPACLPCNSRKGTRTLLESLSRDFPWGDPPPRRRHRPAP